MKQTTIIKLSQTNIKDIIAKEYGVSSDCVRFGNHPYWIDVEIEIDEKHEKKCSECEFCFKSYFGASIWYCCYDGNINYTPGLIYGKKPDWCPYK